MDRQCLECQRQGSGQGMNRTGQPLELPTPDRRKDQENAQEQGGGVSKGQVRQITAGQQRGGQDRGADTWGGSSPASPVRMKQCLIVRFGSLPRSVETGPTHPAIQRARSRPSKGTGRI